MEKSQAKTAYKNHSINNTNNTNTSYTKDKDTGKAKKRETAAHPEAKGSHKHDADIDHILGFDTNDGHARNVRDMPSQRSGKIALNNKSSKPEPKSASNTAASSPTSGDDQQRHTAQQTADRATRKHPRDLQPKLRTIDKVMVDAALSPEQIESAIAVCKQWHTDGCAIRITNQSSFWEAMFVYYLDAVPDDDLIKTPSVTLYFNSRGKNSSVGFRLQLNPHHLNAQHVDCLCAMWEKLFSFFWLDVRQSARFYRGDEASDFEGVLDNILLDRKASQVKDNYFIKTNRSGKIQTQYIGEATAASRGIIYDHDLAQLFRNPEGAPIPLNRETATHVLEHERNSKRTVRVESRRIFEPKLTYAEFVQTPSAFHEFNLFDLSRLRPRDRRDTGFMLYVEWVRLRGIHGAKHCLYELQGKNAATKRTVADYEARLARAQCEWWLKMDRQQQLGALLKALPVNKFLKKIGMQSR